jgi:hypothetical protein
MAGGGGGAAPKQDDLTPHPVKDQLPGVSYCITSPPPWRESPSTPSLPHLRFLPGYRRDGCFPVRLPPPLAHVAVGEQRTPWRGGARNFDGVCSVPAGREGGCDSDACGAATDVAVPRVVVEGPWRRCGVAFTYRRVASGICGGFARSA